MAELFAPLDRLLGSGGDPRLTHQSGERAQRIWLPAFSLPGYAELLLQHRDIDFGSAPTIARAKRGIR